LFWLACQRRVPTVSCNYGFWTFYFAKNFTVYFSWMEWKKLNSVSSAHMTASLTVKTFNIFLCEVTFFLQRGGSLIICFFWYRFSSTFCLMKNCSLGFSNIGFANLHLSWWLVIKISSFCSVNNAKKTERKFGNILKMIYEKKAWTLWKFALITFAQYSI